MEACRELKREGEQLSLEIDTKPYGRITINEDQIIDFPEGVPGFDYISKFVILEVKDSPFVWLQAYDEPGLAFIMMSPLRFMAQYELVISQSDMEAVGTKNPDDLLVYTIVTIPDNNPSEMTANLQGPIIVNPENKLGKQAISLSDKYLVRHRVMDEVNNCEASKE